MRIPEAVPALTGMLLVMVASLHHVHAGTGTSSCKYYREGRRGPCNLKTRMRVRTVALKQGDSDCPSSREIQEPCSPMRCKYTFAGWGRCNKLEQTRVKLFKLRPGQPETCPQEKRKFRPCKKKKKKTAVFGCKYKKGRWSDCDRLTGLKTRSLTLKKGKPSHCESVKMVHKKCTPAKGSRTKHLPIKGSVVSQQPSLKLPAPPGKPRIDAFSVLDTSVQLTWHAGKGAGHSKILAYSVEYFSVNSKEQAWKTASDSISETTYTVDNLQPATLYMFQVRARNAIGVSEPSQVSDTVRTQNSVRSPPKKLQELRLQPGSNVIDVLWTPPQASSLVTGYTLGYGKGIPDVHMTVIHRQKLAYTIRDLIPNTEYVVSLRAFNKIGDGRAIYETVKTLKDWRRNSILHAPVGMQISAQSSSSIVLAWTDTNRKSDMQLPDSYFYTIRYSRLSEKYRYSYMNTTDTSVQIHDLDPFTEYQVAVRVIEGKDQSTWSLDAYVRTMETAPSQAPSDLTVLVKDDQSDVTVLSWQPPGKPNGIITGYTVWYTTNPQADQSEWTVSSVSGDMLSLMVSNLTSSTQYYFKIQARNRKGYGPMSSAVSILLGEPEDRGVPMNVAVSTKPGVVTVTWRPPVKSMDTITGYIVSYGPKDHDGDWSEISVSGSEHITTIQDLNSCSVYYVKVQAEYDKEVGPKSSPVSFNSHTVNEHQCNTCAQLPAPCRNGATCSDLPNGIGFSCLCAKGWVGLRCGSKAEDCHCLNGGTCHYSAGTFFCECPRYWKGTRCEYRSLCVVLDCPEGRECDGVRCSPKSVKKETLMPPVGLKARGLDSKRVILTWSDLRKKKKKKKKKLMKYSVRYRVVKPSLGLGYENKTVDVPSAVIAGLEANMEYEMSVRAEQKSARSPWSMPITIRTMEAAPGGPPEDITVTTMSDRTPGTVTVSWQPPSKPNGLITGYQVLYTAVKDARGRDWVLEDVGGDSLSIVLKDLTPNTLYFFKVQARNREGKGPVSKVVQYSLPDQECQGSDCTPIINPCENSPCPKGTNCVAMVAEKAKYICMCRDGQRHPHCMNKDGN